ncbi:hexokinase [Dysgonomonas sp. OttesenSCG-928-M03]|nr:hexokinase [Dysgonomonas sp. OttesenSCG-928-M03]
MMKNIFKLKTKQLKEIALSLQTKVEKGLSEKDTEIQCLPTFINPNTNINKGKALVLDLGGTNYRAALVDFVDGKPEIHPENGWKKDLSVMKTPGFTREQLYKEIADLISELKLDEEMPIGYCFSYPAESLTDGDARQLRWTKGVNIQEMIGEPVGKPLLDYLNKNLPRAKFTDIKVINDTVASLFAGLTEKGYDAYIGLIVGTGTNMATFVPSENISKLPAEYSQMGLMPINLESGNFHPPHLTIVDDKVDAASDVKGAQRFEKAVSGMYLGEIMKYVFSTTEFEEKFDAQKLTHILNYSDMYKEKYVNTARQIYKRSAQLVAASLAGLVLTLVSKTKTIKKVQLTAEGSLFWSEDRKGKNYRDMVLDELQDILVELGYNDIQVHISKMDNANLIGSAIAALS